MKFESANTRNGLLSIWLSAVIAVAISFVAANPDLKGQWSERMSVTYRMGEADSQMTAIRMARDKLRQKAISESGAYIQNTQILTGDRFSESVRLLKAAFVFLSEDSFRIEVDPGSRSQTLHYEALVGVDTKTLRDRVAALQKSTTFESDLKRLYLTDKAIGENLAQLEKKLGSSGLNGDLLSGYKDALTNAREVTIKRVANLNPGSGSSLLERSQYGGGILELGKLRALEEYYFDILGTYSKRLDVEAKVVSAAPSSVVANATEVTVDMTITFSAYESSGNVIYELKLLEQKLKSIQRGDFWLGTAEGGPSSKMQAMRLGGYNDWVDTELSNMPLMVVTSLGNHERYFTALGGAGILKGKGSRIEFNRKGSRNFKFPGAFTSNSPEIYGYSGSASYKHKRIDKRTYVFQLPNEEAAIINGATVELRLMKIPK